MTEIAPPDDPDALAVQTLIFDLGGVVVDWNPRYLFDQLIADPEARDFFLTTVCSPEWNLSLDRGVPLHSAVSTRSAEFPEWAEQIRAYALEWARMLGDPLPGMTELLRALHDRLVPLYAITNWSAETFPYALERYPILDVFRDIVVSGREGLVKPDAAIFQLALKRFDLAPEQCLFIDDQPRNVAGAQRAGMRAVRFTGAAELRAHPDVVSLLAPPPATGKDSGSA